MADADLPAPLRERCRNATVTAADHLNLETRARQCMENVRAAPGHRRCENEGRGQVAIGGGVVLRQDD